MRHGDRVMEDGRQLSDYGLAENDLVVVDRVPTAVSRTVPAPAAAVPTPPQRSTAPPPATPQYSLADQMYPLFFRFIFCRDCPFDSNLRLPMQSDGADRWPVGTSHCCT